MVGQGTPGVVRTRAGQDGRQRWIKAADLPPVDYAGCLAVISSAESQRCESLMAQAGSTHRETAMTQGEQEQVAWASRGESASNRALIREERGRPEAMQAMRLADSEAEALVMQARPLAFTERAWGLARRPRRSKNNRNDQRQCRRSPHRPLSIWDRSNASRDPRIPRAGRITARPCGT